MSVSTAPVRLPVRRFGETSRRDAWWIQPSLSSWACRRSSSTRRGPRSRAITTRTGRTSRRSTLPKSSARRRTAGSGRTPATWPSWLPFSPALLILPIPGFFRLTCYYYRGAYYKAFWADPPSCTVGEPRKRYRGEHSFPLVLQNIHRYMLFLSLGVLFILYTDVWKALWFTDPATGQVSFGIGVGTLVLATNCVFLSALPVRLSFAASCRWRMRRSSCRARRWASGVLLRELPQSAAHGVGVVQPLHGGLLRPVRPALLDGRVVGRQDLVMPEYQTHEHDVLVIGAGGAGLRAAIEASAGGVSVGLVCKSLLGKAHTVMAEGGIAAALANVDDRDNWKVHFADTMRGGQYVNNWRMAELHAKEAPDRVRELEAWGAMFDRTKDGRILQRNFGGHRYPRLAHVGDRTGLEMIRTLQDHGIHQGIDVHMECTVISAAQGRRSRRRRVRLRARARPVQAVQSEGGRAGDGRHRPRLQDHQQQLGVHRRRSHARLRRRAPS